MNNCFFIRERVIWVYYFAEISPSLRSADDVTVESIADDVTISSQL